MAHNSQITQESNMSIIIRRATESDSKDVWEWRNDPESKANSISEDNISWDIHCSWYQHALQNPDKFIYIGIDSDENKIGMCRFDVIENQAEVSIIVNPLFRKKKISKPLLTTAINQFSKASTIALHATIKHTNILSQQCFLKAGFRHIMDDDIYKYYHRDCKERVDLNKLKLIDEIELIRSKNNINWMNLLRLSFQAAPNEAKLLFRKINADDQRISELFSKLAE